MRHSLTPKLRHFFTNLGLYFEEEQKLCKQIILASNLSDKHPYPFHSDDDSYNTLSYFDKEQLNHLKPNAIFLLESRPFILFYDVIGETDAEKRSNIAKHHTWIYDTAPIVIILTDRGIEVLNAFSYNKKEGIKGEIWEQEEIDKQFSYFALMSGQAWQKWQEKQYTKVKKKQQAGRFNETLLNNIRELRDRLVDSKDSPLLKREREATTFLLRLIFIRYLIDREVDIREHINGNTVEEKRMYFHKEIIPHYGKLKNLFAYIDDSWMNGDLFKMEIRPSDKQLQDLAIIFTGKTSEIDSLQLKFDLYFDIFDFSIIPVETISGIYESVLSKEARKKNAAIYTPPFLVEYVLSETLDKTLNNNLLPVILDPAMGSGIFLVQAFRHIVYKNKEFARIAENDYAERTAFLKKTVKECIFGIDIDESAVNVAAFSLYIAILDFLRPVEIAQIQLPNLIANNLFYNDFFNEEDTGKLFDIKSPKWSPNDFNKKLREKKFDFIIGNPPWKRYTFSQEDKLDEVNYFEKYKQKTKKYQPITGNEIAQGFLYRSLDFAQKETQCALIVTSKAFHNGEATKFKSAFLSKVLLHQFMDLSPVRRLLFNASDTSEKAAIGPAAIVIYQRIENEEAAKSNITKHISVKSNIFLKHFRTLVIDQSADIKPILQAHFITHKWMFKVALYGSGLDFVFLKRLKQNSEKVESYIDNIYVFSGDGIKQNDKSVMKSYWDDLIGFPIIEHNQIKPFFTPLPNKMLAKEDVFIVRGRKIENFKGAKILLKARPWEESEIPVSYIEDSCVYREKVLGISSETNPMLIKALTALFSSKLATYFLFLTSSSWGISLPEINQDEFTELPFKLSSRLEQIIPLIDEIVAILADASRHVIKPFLFPNYQKLIQYEKINQIISELYQITSQEQDLIAYTLDVSRYQFQESKQKQQKFLRKPTPVDLEKYAQVFIAYFGELFDGGEGEYFQVRYYMMPYFTAMRFEIVKEKPMQPIAKEEATNEKQLFSILSQSASLHKQTDDIFIKKVVKGFDYKSFYIIKPNEYKSWHPAIAHLDVEEFDQAIVGGELDRIAEGGANVYG